MDERTATIVSVAYQVAYCCAVAAMLLMLFPAARLYLWHVGADQLYAWRRGRWLASRTPPPSWTAELVRDDLPHELS